MTVINFRFWVLAIIYYRNIKILVIQYDIACRPIAARQVEAIWRILRAGQEMISFKAILRNGKCSERRSAHVILRLCWPVGYHYNLIYHLWHCCQLLTLVSWYASLFYFCSQYCTSGEAMYRLFKFDDRLSLVLLAFDISARTSSRPLNQWLISSRHRERESGGKQSSVKHKAKMLFNKNQSTYRAWNIFLLPSPAAFFINEVKISYFYIF